MKKPTCRKTTARERALVSLVRFYLRLDALCDCGPAHPDDIEVLP